MTKLIDDMVTLLSVVRQAGKKEGLKVDERWLDAAHEARRREFCFMFHLSGTPFITINGDGCDWLDGLVDEPKGEITAVVVHKRQPPFDNWHVLVEVCPESFWADTAMPDHTPGAPRVVVRQHRDTREIRVDVFGCDDGLDVTFTNGGVDPEVRDRAKWFRDVRTARGSLVPLTVRFMGGDLKLRS